MESELVISKVDESNGIKTLSQKDQKYSKTMNHSKFIRQNLRTLQYDNNSEIERKKMYQKQTKEGACGLPSMFGQKLMGFDHLPSIKPFQNETDAGKLEIIDVNEVKLDKKVLIIMNPRSGRRREIGTQLDDYMIKQKIQYTIYETKSYMDAYQHVRSIDLSPYSALFTSGGDGTIHECVNGLLSRSDGQQIPVGFLPNGTGNDTCFCFQISTIQQALNAISNRESIKLDVIKILIDYESEEELHKAASQNPKIKITDHIRYSLINSSIGLVAIIAKRAEGLKRIMGQSAYKVQALIEFMRNQYETYDVEFDNGPIKLSNITTNYFLAFNGKYGGGHINLSPFSLMNDGMAEANFFDRRQSIKTCINLFQDSKDGGKHIYTPDIKVMRFKTLKLTNKSTISKTGELKPQDINIDGEQMIFQKFVKFEVLHKKLEVLVDFEQILKHSNNES